MKIWLLTVLVFIPMLLQAQVKRHDTLRTIRVSGRRVYTAPGVQTIDSSVLQYGRQQSLQQVLELHSNVFVKNYGIGSLSTISMRGSSAAQTTVLWNGVSVNNVMSGISDFSLLPVHFFDQIRVNYTGQHANAPGGTIELQNEPVRFEKAQTVQLGAAWESLRNQSGLLSVKTSGNGYALGIRAFRQVAQNRFRFYHPEKETFDTLRHATSQGTGVLADLFIKTHEYQTLAAQVWWQQSKREIPPALFEQLSRKNEYNRSLKAVMSYDIRLYQLHSHTLAGYLQDEMQYSDSLIGLYSRASSIAIPFSQKLDWYSMQKSQKISLEIPAQWSALTNRSNTSLSKAGLILRYECEPFPNRLWIRTHIQREISNVFSLPFALALQIRQKIFKHHFVGAHLSSNYRMPTLNELYFVPGGNTDLKPETARNLEGNLENHFTNRSHMLIVNTNVYTRKVKNWIVWYGGSILTPHNIQEVWSRGVEADLQYRYTFQPMVPQPSHADTLEFAGVITAASGYKQKKSTAFILGIRYAYTLSTTEASAFQNDYSIGKQIPYVPRYQLKIDPGLEISHFSLHWLYAYTGYRFVTTDESAWLLPYATHHLMSSARYQLPHKQEVLFTFRINNLLNRSYESIVGRMMPGRSVTFGLHYRFQ